MTCWAVSVCGCLAQGMAADADPKVPYRASKPQLKDYTEVEREWREPHLCRKQPVK